MSLTHVPYRPSSSPWISQLLRPRFNNPLSDLPPSNPTIDQMLQQMLEREHGGALSSRGASEMPERNLRGVGWLLTFVYRVVNGCTHNFSLRVADWTLSSMLLVFGAILLGPEDTFKTGSAYAYLAKIAAENVWGWACVSIAVLRLFALLVNGTFQGFRWSPHVRFGCALATCFIWFQISLGMGLAAVRPTGLAVYPFLFLLDLYNTFLAASEAGVAERRFRNGFH